MKNQFLPTLGILSAIGVLGLASVPVSALEAGGGIKEPSNITVPAQCRSAFAFQFNDFGDCSPRLSVSSNPSASLTTFARRADIQVAQAVAQYNSNFAANYAQRVASNNNTRVASSRIQCPTNSVSQVLCQPGQTQATLSINQHRVVLRR
jgi:hypothetical protein